MPAKAKNKSEQTKTNSGKNAASGKKSKSNQQTTNKKAPKGNTKAESVERNTDTDQE